MGCCSHLHSSTSGMSTLSKNPGDISNRHVVPPPNASLAKFVVSDKLMERS